MCFEDNVHVQGTTFKYNSSNPGYLLNTEAVARAYQLLYHQQLKIKTQLTEF